jgi:hypothetical protein
MDDLGVPPMETSIWIPKPGPERLGDRGWRGGSSRGTCPETEIISQPDG